MSQNFFVLPSYDAAFASSTEYAMYGFRTILPNAQITGQDEDPDHPFSFCIDYGDDTQYSPLADSGSVAIEITTGSSEEVNYLGLAIFNGASSGLSIELEYFDNLTSQFIQLFSFNSLKDASPLIAQFNPVQTNRFRINLTWTSKLYIGCVYIGNAIRFPRTPSIGFQPPKYNRLDEVKSFQTTGNNFTRSRLIVRNNQAKGAFNFYRFDELDSWWSEYLDHIYQSKAVFFQWSNEVDDPIYGRENINTPPRITYKNSLNASIPFEFNGYANR